MNLKDRYWVWFDKYCDESYEGGLNDISFTSDDLQEAINYANKYGNPTNDYTSRHKGNLFDRLEAEFVELPKGTDIPYFNRHLFPNECAMLGLEMPPYIEGWKEYSVPHKEEWQAWKREYKAWVLERYPDTVFLNSLAD